MNAADAASQALDAAARRWAENDNAPRLIAFTGKAGAGKSTAADILVAQGWTRVKFAAPLKAMCRAIGMTEAQIEGDEKELPSPLMQGHTPRYVMQTLGAEWGRDLIGPSFWIDLWEDSAARCLDEGGRVVVDDCRYPNEADVIRKLGGVLVELAGRGGIAGSHGSEAGGLQPDKRVWNGGLLETLAWEVKRLVA